MTGSEVSCVLLQDYRAGSSEKLAAKKDELLTVVNFPEVPLHNNDPNLGARVSAYEYLRDRLSRQYAMPSLAHCIQ